MKAPMSETPPVAPSPKEVPIPPAVTMAQIGDAYTVLKRWTKDLSKHSPALQRWIVESLAKSLPEEKVPDA